MEEIWFAPGALEHARRFHGGRPTPSEDEMRDAIRAMICECRRYGLAPGRAPLPWTPPPPLSGYDHLGLETEDGQLNLFATGLGSAGQPRAFTVGVDTSQEGLTGVVQVAVVAAPESARREGLDPQCFAWEYQMAHGVQLVQWGFVRGSRHYELRVSGPLEATGRWAAALAGFYEPGETFDVSTEFPLLAKAAVDGRRPARHRWLGDRRVELLEAAAITAARSLAVFDTPGQAFDHLVDLLPISGLLAALGRAPDSRLR